MPEKKKQKQSTFSKDMPLKEYLEKLPPPPQEHEYELEMEKLVNRLVKEKHKKDKIRGYLPRNIVYFFLIYQ
jgi:hypothetical protein